MGVRCYYIALSLVIAVFGREFSSLKSRIQVEDIWLSMLAMPNQQFQFVPGLTALHRTALSPLRSAKAAAEQWRYVFRE